MVHFTEDEFEHIVKLAWKDYDSSRSIATLQDISAKVSTNHVFKITLHDGGFAIAKLSYFGKFEHFAEDHQIIQVLSNNLPIPYERFLARSLMKNNKLYVYRYQYENKDAWVVFYLPLRIKDRLPSILSYKDINNLAREFAYFHKVCTVMRHTLPKSSKILTDDLLDMLQKLNEDTILGKSSLYRGMLVQQCEAFLLSYHKYGGHELPQIPVFVDWNIGNFSLFQGRFYSRWDYDWFRVGTRILDFYFISRVVSEVGDRTTFTYNVAPLNGARFHYFLEVYHKIFNLTKEEVYLIKEGYRFFLLHYVIHFGNHFFSEHHAQKLQSEVLETHFKNIDQFDPEIIISKLKLS
jgi:hypothetical protein